MYNLAKVEFRAPTPPKFRRDSMAIDDIEGTRSRPIFKGGANARTVNKNDDIDGSSPMMRHRARAD